MSEARAFEGVNFAISNASFASPDTSDDPIQSAYQDMMGSMVAAMNV
jgi:hypothetical protein